MAQRVVTTLEDDIHGGKASETVTFALDGVQYEIDLNDKNAKNLRNMLASFVEHARRTSSRRKQGAPVRDFDPKAVRRWAEANGIEISVRGRISAGVVQQFKAAGH